MSKLAIYGHAPGAIIGDGNTESPHMNKRSNYPYRERFVAPIIFGKRSDPPRICESQTYKISVLDLTLADRARVLKFKMAATKNKTQAIEGSLIFFFHILNGYEGSL